MPTVKCCNDIVIHGEKKTCDKFLAILPVSVTNALKANPKDKITLRCHDCPGETKWVDVYYSPTDGFTWDIHSGEINFGKDIMEFKVVKRSSILGG